MKARRFIVTIALLLLTSAGVAFAEPQREAALPSRGILVSGQSLAGVRLGHTRAQVEAAWGTHHVVCAGCALPTWFYTYPDKPVGAAVIFDRTQHAIAVFTLGSTFGWRTQKGLMMGSDIHSAVAMYPNTKYKACIGYSALSSRDGDVVTSIYTQAEVVYGFAITLAGAPVCI